MHFVMVEQLSTLKRIVSPAVTDVVHPVKVASVALFDDEIVGFADAVIVSATVGG